MAKIIIGALYKGGFDEIRLLCKLPELIRECQEFTSQNCIGFEVVEQGKSSLVLRKISDTIYKEFEPVFKRLVLFVKTMAKESVEAIKSHDLSGYENVILMDTNVNKLAYYCLRILNKHPETRSELIGPFYDIIDQIEGIGDAYKDMCAKMRNNRKKLPISMIRTIECLNSYLNHTLLMLQTKNQEDLQKALQLSNLVKLAIGKIVPRTTQESLVLARIIDIGGSIRNIVSPITLLLFAAKNQEATLEK